MCWRNVLMRDVVKGFDIEECNVRVNVRGIKGFLNERKTCRRVSDLIGNRDITAFIHLPNIDIEVNIRQ